MKINRNSIILCKKIIHFCADLFSIRVPDIYFIYNKKNNYRLMNAQLETISYDYRSLDSDIEYIDFDYKHYQMYINLDIFHEEMLGMIIVVRKMRELYHISQIQKLRKQQPIQEDKRTILQWKHAYEVQNQRRYEPESWIEIDQNAFVKYIIYLLFDMDLKFKVLSLETFRKQLRRIELKYDDTKIIDLAEKHKIKVKPANYYCIDNFEVEILSG